MDLNNFSLFFLLIIFALFFNKYFPLTIYKFKLKILIDDEFKKPQAFHKYPVSTSGGISIFFSFLILCFYFSLSKQVIYYEYLSFCTLFFALGLLDDLKFNIPPKFRLILMFVFLITLIITNEFYIENTGINFLNRFLEIDIFAVFFICLCFLFIINGSNLIDGYNGLLSIHTIIILINLFFINYFNENYNLVFFIFAGIIIVAMFLLFNFPKATIFLGDSGSYFLGSFIAISVIKTSIENPQVSPFYFCLLLFYLFFEVFFSFIRKILIEKKSPLFPDSKHLHMLLYKMLLKKNKDKFKSNYYVSIIINLTYLILIIPSIFMMNNGLFCKYYSLVLFIIYLFAYKKISRKLR
jgi:UDP-N-acetylmuramyl pentapeptide phosphotransferase/UDP-N-acetylglucosamine-1-phosphate transferase